jgi:hypothetical protein
VLYHYLFILETKMFITNDFFDKIDNFLFENAKV